MEGGEVSDHRKGVQPTLGRENPPTKSKQSCSPRINATYSNTSKSPSISPCPSPMPSVIRHNIATRTSFTEMAPFNLNQVVKGLKGSYQIIKTLKPNVFQAKVEGTSTLSALPLL